MKNTKKKKQGRPSLGDDARVQRVVLKVSARELVAIKAKAKAAGMPVSVWILQPRRDELEGK